MFKVLIVALLTAFAQAYAQTPVAPAAPIAPPAPVAPPTPPVPPVPAVPPVPPVLPFGDDVTMFVSSDFGGRTVIKGAPYSATAVNESKQMLSDGNQIERSSTIKLYRDSQGRTRQEQAGGVVFINDVVAGKRYVLSTHSKSARELRLASAPLPPAPPLPPASMVAPGTPMPPPPKPAKPHSEMTPEESRSWADEMRRWARELRERVRGEQSNGSDAVVSRTITRTDTTGADMRADHVEIISHAGRTPVPPTTMQLPPGPGNTTALGSREFDGVRAEGKRTAWTIPAGRIGNKLPIEIVSERWYSPELNVVVLTRHADPRSGERIYRLENIKREEPNAELFKVPADFALKTRPGSDERR